MKKTNLKRGMLLTVAVALGGTSVSLAQAPQERKTTNSHAAEAAGWQEVFTDRFDRDALGDNWQIVDGAWEITDGCLRGSGSLVSVKGFPGNSQRLEFEAMTDVKPLAFLVLPGSTPQVTVCDISSFLQVRSPADGHPLATGYFFQFGGFNNTLNKITKQGRMLVEKREDTPFIAPDKWHKIVAENDAGTLRLFVDGALVLEHAERGEPLAGEGQDRIGFYFHTAVKVRLVTVFVKRTVEREKDD